MCTGCDPNPKERPEIESRTALQARRPELERRGYNVSATDFNSGLHRLVSDLIERKAVSGKARAHHQRKVALRGYRMPDACRPKIVIISLEWVGTETFCSLKLPALKADANQRP